MSLAPKHSIEDNEKFTHAGGQGLLCRFAFHMQELIEILEEGIAADCDDGTHIL